MWPSTCWRERKTETNRERERERARERERHELMDEYVVLTENVLIHL